MMKERVPKKLYRKYLSTGSDDLMDFYDYVRVTRPYRMKKLRNKVLIVSYTIIVMYFSVRMFM